MSDNEISGSQCSVHSVLDNDKSPDASKAETSTNGTPKQRGKGVVYYIDATYETAEEARKVKDDENIWAHSNGVHGRRTKQGVIERYRCKLVQCRGTQCKASIYICFYTLKISHVPCFDQMMAIHMMIISRC